MRGTSKVTEKDHGYKRLKKELFGAKRNLVAVGVFAEEGARAYAGKAGEERPKGAAVTVLDVALWNHYGTANIPARPFLSLYFDTQTARVQERAATLFRSVVAGKRTRLEALDLLGQVFVGDIQRAMTVGYFGSYPGNADSTIARKGSATPLVDTGQLRSSITYRVTFR